MQQGEFSMKRSVLQLTVVALSLTIVAAANAKGNSGSKGSNGGPNNGSFNKSQSMSSSYKSSSKPYGQCYYKSGFYCSHKCYCDYFGCYCYWYPVDHCWCFWYQPWGCYIPWSTYVTLGTPVVTQPAVAQVGPPPAPPAP
jgi:hypothetical protein